MPLIKPYKNFGFTVQVYSVQSNRAQVAVATGNVRYVPLLSCRNLPFSGVSLLCACECMRFNCHLKLKFYDKKANDVILYAVQDYILELVLSK